MPPVVVLEDFSWYLRAGCPGGCGGVCGVCGDEYEDEHHPRLIVGSRGASPVGEVIVGSRVASPVGEVIVGSTVASPVEEDVVGL